MGYERGRFAASAEGHKTGITILVPRPVVDAEQSELMSMITSSKVQNIIVFLRRGGLRHLDIDEKLKKGEYKGYCPLHAAVLCGTTSVVSAMLELARASPNITSTKKGDTPLHLACRKGEVGMVRSLLKHGADPNLANTARLTPLLCAASGPTTSREFHHMAAGELIRSGASLVARDKNGDTPLHLACDTPLALPLVAEMVKAGSAHSTSQLSDAVEALNIQGEGVLHRACSRGLAEVSRILLKAGARSDARSAAGDTAMHCAARSGLESIAMHLLENPDLALNASNLSGETPLHLAMSSNTAPHARIARTLLARGAFAFGRTRNGESVLHACAREGNTPLAELILSRQTQSTVEALNARANNGGTPLHVAVQANQSVMVDLLLAQVNVDRAVSDNEGNTAVHIACHRGDIKLLMQLLRAGRGVGARELSVRNALGWAALHTCAFHGHDTALKHLLQWQSPVELPTADGWTALHLACSQGHLSCVRSLLASGASIDTQHPNGESALGIAAARGNHQVVSELLSAGASPAAPSDDRGWTPMHAALAHGDESVALALLEKGGRIRSRKDGRLPDVGEPIDLADPLLRDAVLDADERRRQKNRLEGRDSDDGEDWELHATDDTVYKHWPAPPSKMSHLMLPSTPYPPRVARPDRTGFFGYYGDIRDVQEAIQHSKQTFLGVPPAK